MDKVVNPSVSSSRNISISSKRKRTSIANEITNEWIRCNNPTCGKWRCIAKGYDINSLLYRNTKRNWGATSDSIENSNYNNNMGWYCWMNTWDETFASCTAPQEPINMCKWNMSEQ